MKPFKDGFYWMSTIYCLQSLQIIVDNIHCTLNTLDCHVTWYPVERDWYMLSSNYGVVYHLHHDYIGCSTYTPWKYVLCKQPAINRKNLKTRGERDRLTYPHQRPGLHFRTISEPAQQSSRQRWKHLFSKPTLSNTCGLFLDMFSTNWLYILWH